MTAKDLKNALLQEAVQGKLVPQIASEGNARDLLEEIKIQKASLIKKGKIKKEKPLPEISEDEIPFDIPDSWCWCRLGDIISIETNLVDSSKYLDYIQIAPDDIGKGTGTLITERKTVRQKEIKSINHLFHADMVLYSKIRPRLQKVVYVDFEGLCSADMYPLQTKINKLYLKYVLLSEFFDKEIKDFENRVKMPKLNKEQLNSTKFPLPPLSEQKRIVAAIEKSMPLIEEYGKKETVLNELNAQIGTLTKKAILQEAVQGKLVPQLPTEGNAKDLLEQIKAQKVVLIKEGKIKKEKPLPEITEDEIPFDIPENWCWCRLGEIVNKLTDGTHRTPKYVEKGIPFLSVKNLSSGKMDFENTKFITLEEHKELYARCNPEKGDMLLTKVGTTGIPVINDSDVEFSLFVSVALLKFSHEYINEKYFLYLLQSPLVQEQAQENTKGVGNKNWVMDAIAKTVLVLPPLSEQKRIVTAIEQLLPLCEKLGK